MRVPLLDFEHRTITIEDSKNGDGRTVKMTQKVFELLKACCEGKGENDLVFIREGGKQVKDFREAWANARKAVEGPPTTSGALVPAICGAAMLTVK